MKLLLSILLFITCGAVMGQAPGSVTGPFSIPKPYGTPNNVTQEIGLFTPFDSTSGAYLHPCIIMAPGDGETTPPNNYVITGNTLFYWVKNNGGTAMFRDSIRHIWVTYYIIWLYKNKTADLSGTFDVRYYKNAWKYATTTLAGKVDPNRIYFQGLSLSGGAILDFLQDSAIWCNRIAAMSSGSAVGGLKFTGNSSDWTTIKNTLNTTATHWRGYWATNDPVGEAATARDKARFYYGAPMLLQLDTTGGHGGGWKFQNDTLHPVHIVDSAFAHSGNPAWNSVSYIHNQNVFEWYLNFTASVSIANQLPVSNAGSPQTIVLPTASVNLNGSASYDPDGRALSAYLWTRTSGPNTPTIVSSTSVSTSVTGLIQGTYIFNLRVTDDSAATANSTVTITVSPAPAANYQAKFFQHFGSEYATTDNNTPDKWFDSQKSGKFNANPKYAVLTDTTSLSNPAHGWNKNLGAPTKNYDQYGFGVTNKGVRYYTRDSIKSRCRVVIDLVGTKNPLDLSRKFKFTDIYGLDSSLSGIKAYFYNFDSVVMRATATRWKYWARFDSLMTPMAILTNTGAGTWTSTGCLDSCRYVMIVITQNNFSYIANYKELAFYGAYNFDTSSTVYKDSLRDQIYKGAFPSKKNANYTFAKTVGQNLFTSAGVNTRKYTGPLRQYTAMGYLDTANTPGVHTSFWYQYETFPTLNNTTLATMKAEGHDVFFTNTGARTYNANNGQSHVNNDTLNQEVEQPGIWRNESSALANLARVLGRNASGVNAFTTHPANGQNLATTMEMGNETKGHGYTMLSDYFRMKQVYDSIKAVDSTMIVRMPGAIEWSSNDIRNVWFAAWMFTDDHEIPFDRVQGHHYFSTVDSIHTGTTLDDRLLSQHEAPENAINSRTGQLKYVDSTMREQWAYVQLPNDITETGGGADGTLPANTTQANGWDYYCTPGRSIWDSAQYNSILNLRSAIQFMFSPVGQVVFYSMFDQQELGGTRGNQLFWGYGLGGNQIANAEMGRFYAGWYHMASVYKRLANYYPDSIMRNGGNAGVWQYKLRHKDYPDSVVYMLNYGTKNGTSGSVNINTQTATSVEEYVPSFTSITGTSTTLTPSSGSVTRSINEAPKFYFAKEVTVTLPAGCPCSTLQIKRYP